MESPTSSQGIFKHLIEKLLDRHFLLLMLCLLFYANSSLVTYTHKSIFEITSLNQIEGLGVGILIFYLALFAVLINLVFPSLRIVVMMGVLNCDRLLDAFYRDHRRINLVDREGIFSLGQLLTQALITKNVVAYQEHQLRKQEMEQQEAVTQRCFSITVLVIADVVICWRNASLKASVIGWTYDRLGTEATILNSLAIVFCAFLFGYCLYRSLDPMDHLDYVFVGKDYDRSLQQDAEGKS